MVALGSPIAGVVRPAGSPLIYGSFRVTSSFAAHVASGRPLGVDIGNGKQGEPILAMADGKVAYSDWLGDPAAPYGKAKVVRIDHQFGDGHTWQTGYAHLATIETKKGLWVKRGDRIGTLGTTGAASAHCHIGLKRDGVEVDWWLLLDNQTPGSGMPAFKIGSNIGTFRFVGVHALISPMDTKVVFMQLADAGPFDVAASLDLKKPDGQPVDIDGNSPPRNQRDQVYLVDAPTFGVAAYALRQDGVFTPKVDQQTAALVERLARIKQLAS